MITAHWISDGSEVPEGSVGLLPPPRGREWRIGRYTFRRAPRAGRWSCEVSNAGAAQYRTPFGAFLTARRAARSSRHQVTVNVAGTVTGERDLAGMIQRAMSARNSRNRPGFTQET